MKFAFILGSQYTDLTQLGSFYSPPHPPPTLQLQIPFPIFMITVVILIFSSCLHPLWAFGTSTWHV